MSVIDLLVTIIIVTILVTIGLGVVTYVAYKLRLARRPRREEEAEAGAPRYFRRYEPPKETAAGAKSGADEGLGEKPGREAVVHDLTARRSA